MGTKLAKRFSAMSTNSFCLIPFPSPLSWENFTKTWQWKRFYSSLYYFHRPVLEQIIDKNGNQRVSIFTGTTPLEDRKREMGIVWRDVRAGTRRGGWTAKFLDGSVSSRWFESVKVVFMSLLCLSSGWGWHALNRYKRSFMRTDTFYAVLLSFSLWRPIDQ